MPRSFRIEVEGLERSAIVVGKQADSIPAALRAASETAAEVLEQSIKDYAPEPRSAEEVQGHGIDTKVERRFRLAGRGKGGLLRTSQTFTISALVKSQSVAAYVEWGTGIYAMPQRRGPHSPYTITAPPGKMLGPMVRDGAAPMFSGRGVTFSAQRRKQGSGEEFWSKHVTIPGTRPAPYIAQGVAAVEHEVDSIFEIAIDEVI